MNDNRSKNMGHAMAISIQRPSGINVGVLNPGDTVYLQGSESIDGSLRLLADPSGLFAVIETRVAGLWTLADLQLSYLTHVFDSNLGQLVFDQNGEGVFEG